MTNRARSFILRSCGAAVGGALLVFAAAACEKSHAAEGQKPPAAPQPSVAAGPGDVSVPYGEDEDSVIVRYRRTKSGKVVADTVHTGPTFDDISVRTADAKLKLPYKPPAEGPGVLHLQVLLDRANFSPGMLSGEWDDNTAHALSWFKRSRGLDSSTVVDQKTYEALASAATTNPLFTRYTLTDADVKGPYVKIPKSVYAREKLDCLCYTSLEEAIAERFHAMPELLEQLNPGVKFASLAAGATVWVPNVARDTSVPAPYTTAKIVISKREFWTHALDSAGRVVAHYPSTLGNKYDPSPTGEFHVVRVSKNPAYHYQPSLYAEVPDDRPEAHLKPGPNSPVGLVWVALSKEHYGIHGTNDPESIGTANSHGCVRLTNWDAWALASSVGEGVPVVFQ